MSFLMPKPKQQYLSLAGLPLIGGKVYTYAAGTATPKATYTDAAMTTPQTNPIILNTRGEPTNGAIFWDGSYKVELRDSLNNLIYTVDNYQTPIMPADLAGAAGAGTIGFLYANVYTAGTIGRWLQDLALSTGASFMGFIQLGVGALLRTVQDKFREYVTITDYTGVVGDGVTNCTDGIRAAIKNNLSLEVPHGTFMCGVTGTSGDFLLYLGTNGGVQTQRDGLTIRGRGPKSIIKLADNAGRNTLLFGLASTDTIKDLTIRDLTIDLNGVNNLQTAFGDPLRYNCAAYLFAYCENVTFDNVVFLNGSGHQIVSVGNNTSAGYGKNIRIKNCRVKNYGIGVPGNKSQDTSAFYIQADGIQVTDNVVECDAFNFDAARGHTAFELHGDSATLVSRNKFKNLQLPWLIASSQKATNNVAISGNRYSECFYIGSLDGSYYDQKVIDIGPGEIFNSTKPAAALLLVGNSAEVAKNRENVRFFGNQVMLWGDANEDTHLMNLTDCYIRSLEIAYNHIQGLNGSAIYYAGTVRNSGTCVLSVHDNDMDSLGSMAGVYPNSPTFVHIETSAGTINSFDFRRNNLTNSSLKNYATFGLVKLTGIINYVYVKENTNAVSSVYPLTTGTPTVLYKDIDRNYPSVWQRSGYEATAFTAIVSGANQTLFDFSAWSNNDASEFLVSVFSTDGSAGNNGMTTYVVVVCGSGRTATRLTNAGTYAADITVQFTGAVLQIRNANASTLFVRPTISGNSSRAVAFSL